MLRRNRISFLEERIKRLEEQNAYLWREKTFGVEALDSAASLGHFDTSLNKLDDPRPILSETIKRVRGLVPLHTAAFYLIGSDSSFYPAYCSPS